MEVVETFVTMLTQWRSGAAGPTGLDYAALPAVLDLLAIPMHERRAVFDGLRTMEGAALDHMHKATK